VANKSLTEIIDSSRPKCGQCCHWHSLGATASGSDDLNLGECRRNPPTLVPEMYDFKKAVADDEDWYCMTRWPLTIEKHWCGEFAGR
jgi:hypothetical protein